MVFCRHHNFIPLERRLKMEETTAKTGLSISALKYIAITAMLIDHIAFAFLDDGEHIILYTIMDLIGRITGPIMFFAAVEGYHHTKNLKKYLLRLFAFALISYLPFMYAWSDHFNPLRLNVIFTIFLGLLAVHARRSIKNIFLKILVISVLILFSISADYGTAGVIMILTFDFFYGNRRNQLAGYLLIVLLDFDVRSFFIHPFWEWVYTGQFTIRYYSLPDNYICLGFLIPFFLLMLYNGQPGSRSKLSKWVFYIFYPAHLVIIGLIRLLAA